MSKDQKNFNELRDMYAKYPSLEEAKKALSEMERSGKNSPEIEENRNRIKDLIARFSGLEKGISRTEGQYQETLTALNAQSPVWNKGKRPIEQSGNIEQLRRSNEVLSAIEEPKFGGTGWLNTLKGKDENVREFLGKFIGPVGQKERVEAQLGLRPSEDEKKLVAYFSQKNPVEIDKFFKSDEYKALKESFLKTLENTGEDKQVFCLTQFAKALTLETEAERKTAVEALLHFDISYSQDQNHLRIFVGPGYGKDEIRRQYPDQIDMHIKGLEGKGIREGRPAAQDSLREIYKLLSLDQSVQYAPSLAILRLLRQGRLEEIGLSRSDIFNLVSYNQPGGYFNFASFDNHGKIMSMGANFDEKQQAVIMAEFKAIIRELLPALNSLQSKKSYELDKFMNEFALLADLKKDFQYEASGNGKSIGAVIQSKDPGDQLLNEVSAQVFQETFLLEQRKQQQARELLLGKKGKVPENMDQDALLQLEPGEYTLSSVLQATQAIIREVEINLYNKVSTYRMSQMEALLSEVQELKSELQELTTKKKKLSKQLEAAGFFQRDLKAHLRQQIAEGEREANSKRKDIAAKVEEYQKIKIEAKIDSKLEAISKLGIVIPNLPTLGAPESGDAIASQQELLALVKNGVLDNALEKKKAELDKRYQNLLVIKRSVENTIDEKSQERAVTKELEILKRIY